MLSKRAQFEEEVRMSAAAEFAKIDAASTAKREASIVEKQERANARKAERDRVKLLKSRE